MFYALLSDICHPSVGGDLWFMDVPQVPCHLRHLAAPHDEMMREFIRRIALPIMVDITRTTEQALKKVYALADSLHKESIH
jgi:hypothetical protein